MKYLKVLSEPNSQSGKDYGYTPYLLGLLSAILYPFTWIYCNQTNLSLAQNTLIRGLACSSIHYLTCTLTSSPTDLPSPSSLRSLILRSLIMTFYSIIISLSQFILPLPVVHTINNSGVIFVFLIDYMVNGVKISVKQGVGIGLGLIGVLVVGNGKFIMSLLKGDGYREESRFGNYVTQDFGVIAGFMGVFVVTMFGWAYGIVLTKRISANTYQINFTMGLIIHLTGALLYPLFTNPTPYPKLLTAVLLTGIPITFTQTIYIAALTMSRNSGMVSMTGFMAVVVSYGISVVRYGEQGNWVTFGGVGLVGVGVWRAVFGGERK